MACSNTFLEGSSAHGGTAVLFTTGGFPALKLRKEVNKNTDQNSYLFLYRQILNLLGLYKTKLPFVCQNLLKYWLSVFQWHHGN